MRGPSAAADACRAAAPLLRRDDAGDRPADRLRRRSTTERDTPIGWVLASSAAQQELAEAPRAVRAGARRRSVSRARRSLRRRRAGALTRASTCSRRAAEEQLSLFGEIPAGTPARGYPLARAGTGSGAAAPSSPPALVFGSCPLRPLFVPLLRRAGGGHARASSQPLPAATDSRRRRSATPPTACSSRSICARRSAPEVERVREWYPAVTDQELVRIADLVSAYCDSELARRVAALPDARPERPFAFEHDGVLLHGRLDVLQPRREPRARRRLQDERPRRPLDRRGDRERVPAPAARLRTRVLPGRSRRGRGRVPFLERPDVGRLDRVHARGRYRSSSTSSPRRSRESTPAISPRHPSEFVCAGCPALDVVCAGMKLPGAPPAREAVVV